MRWRGDQRHAGLAVTQLGNQFVDLVTGQLAAFTGLGPLRHLDLQHFRRAQVGRGDAKAAGGHLFDLGAFFGAIAHRIFAAFAGVGAPAETVHGFGEGFMSFR